MSRSYSCLRGLVLIVSLSAILSTAAAPAALAKDGDAVVSEGKPVAAKTGSRVTSVLRVRSISVNGTPLSAYRTFALGAGSKSATVVVAASGLKPTSFSPSATATLCWDGRWDRKENATAGLFTWHEWIEIEFCMKGSTVTSTKVTSTGGETQFLGWNYEGRVGKSSKVISNQARNYAQHRFMFSILKLGVLQDISPCISLDGTRSFKKNGKTYGVFKVGERCGLS